MRLLWVALAVLTMGVVSGCGVDTYGNCWDSSDCAVSGDRCYELTLFDSAGFVLTDGATCTYGCDFDSDCQSRYGFPGACRGGLCYQICDFNSDCSFDQFCIDVRLDSGIRDFICAPDNFY